MSAADADLNQVLAGSPYLLDADEAGRRRSTFLAEECERIGERQFRVEQRFARERLEIRQRIDEMTGARLVYESNALELAGLPLAETEAIIRAAPQHLTALAEYMAQQAIASDPHILEVLGLHRANLFAKQLARDYRDRSRAIGEIDIRSLHAASLAGEGFAGSYRTE